MEKTTALSALMACLLISTSAPQAGELIRTACVKTNDRHGSLNVRSDANMAAPVVSRIRNGQCGITVIGYCGRGEEAGDWCTIKFGQIRFGVVAARYLTLRHEKGAKP